MCCPEGRKSATSEFRVSDWLRKQRPDTSPAQPEIDNLRDNPTGFAVFDACKARRINDGAFLSPAVSLQHRQAEKRPDKRQKKSALAIHSCSFNSSHPEWYFLACLRLRESNVAACASQARRCGPGLAQSNLRKKLPI